MVFTYSEHALKIAIAQLANNVGWHGIGSNSFEILIDLTARFMREIGKTSSCIANQYNRTEVNFDDLQLAFNYMGISVGELEDYFKHVDPIPFVKGNLSKFPVSTKGAKRINYPDESELKARAEFYEEWLPSVKLDTEDNLLNSKISKDNQLDDDALNGQDLDEEEMDRRYLNSLKSQVAPDQTIGGFTELSALVPNYIYLSENGQVLSFGGKEGKAPECKLPPLTAEDLERIKQEEERMKQEMQKEKTFQPLKLKINNKEKFKKYLKDSKLKNDYMSKELLKRAKKDKKLKPKLNLNKLSNKMSLNANLNKEKLDDEDSQKQKQDLIETAEKLGLSNEINEIKKLNKLKERTQKQKKLKIMKEEDLEKARRKRERMRKKQEELERKQRLREERRQRKEAREREKEEKRKARERKRMERMKEKEKKGPRKPRTPKKGQKNAQSRAELDDTNSNFSMNSSTQTNSMKNNTSTNSNLNEYDEKEAANILVSLSEDKKSIKRTTKKQKESKAISSPLISSSSSDDDESFKDERPNSPASSISSNESKDDAFKFKSNDFKNDEKLSKQPASDSKDNDKQPPARPAFKSLAERKAMPPEILESTKPPPSNNEQVIRKATKFKKRKIENKVNSELEKLFEPSFTLPTIKKKEKKPRKKFSDDYIETSSSSSEDERALIPSKKKDKKKKKKLDESLPKLTVKLPSRTNSPILSPKSLKKDKLNKKLDLKKSKKDLSERKLVNKPKDKKDDSIKESKKIDKLSMNKSNNSVKLNKPAIEPPAAATTPIVENRPKKKAKVIITPTKAARKEAQEKGCVLVTQTVSTNEVDDKVWYCPTCLLPDDSTPMIGCDNCDSWFHWSCLGITSDPTEDSWFCAACIVKQQQIELKFKKKRKSDDQETPTHSNSVGRPSKASSSLENKESIKLQDSIQKLPENKKSIKKELLPKSSLTKKKFDSDVWYCPTCSRPDDTSPMIACDKCDNWFHYQCVNLTSTPPEDEPWYCTNCSKESAGHKHKKQKKS